MASKKKDKITKEGLIKRKFPMVVAGFLAVLAALGINKLADVNKIKNYQEWLGAHPVETRVKRVIDGDTLELEDGGLTVRLLGINAPARGEKGAGEAGNYLAKLVAGKRVYLEYDRYQDDRFARLLAWVWVDCESSPKFLPYDYMHLSYNQSRPGLWENPEGCMKGKLVNEEMVRNKMAQTEFFKDRGEMKYEKRLDGLTR